MKQRFKVGDIVQMTEDARRDTYAENMVPKNYHWRIRAVYTNTNEHPGFDTGVNEALYDIEHLHNVCAFDCSLYDYELELIAKCDSKLMLSMSELSNACGRPISKPEHDCVKRATRLGLESEVLNQASKVNRTIAKIHEMRETLGGVNAQIFDAKLIELLNSLCS